MAFDFDYVTENEVRDAAEGVETDDYTTPEIESIANQFAGILHLEVSRTTQYTNGSREWNAGKTFILYKCQAFILSHFPETAAKAAQAEEMAKSILEALKGITKGKVSKTQGMNNYKDE